MMTTEAWCGLLGEICPMSQKLTSQDVAKYILESCGEITHMKLQKLVYYSQAWSLVWDDQPLFHDRIEAWANGPVVVSLYHDLKGRYDLSEKSLKAGDASKIDAEQKATIKVVLAFYGDKTSQWLSDLTHMEPPWRSARKGLGPGERGDQEITLSEMAEYYGSLMVPEV